MINFNTFELDRLSKLLWSLRDYTTNNLRFPKAGELVEIAYDVYSKGKLKRVNLPGVDLIGTDGQAARVVYLMIKDEDEGWRIAGMQLFNIKGKII